MILGRVLIRMNLLAILFVMSFLLILAHTSLASSLQEQENALNIIADFAERFCGDIPLEGYGKDVDLTGKAKAELNGVISKLVNIGVEGAAKYQDQKYRGLLQKDLVDAIRDSTNCRLIIWNDLKERLLPKNRPPSPVPPVSSTTLPKQWPLVGEETFTEISPGWAEGNYANEHLPRFDLNFVGGKYRWDMEFVNGREQWVDAPYGPSTDFYLAVNVKFIALTPGNISVSLLFGRATSKDYAFRISSDNKFALERFDGAKHEMIISYTPTSINSKESNRIAVAVKDRQIKLYINSKLVGEYKDFTFTGGKVGISVTAWNPGQSTVIDFDNFEYRRKP